MWNLMFNLVTQNKVALTRDMTARFVEVTVLAVKSKEVVDKATIDIEQVECTDIIEHIDEHRLEMEEKDVLPVQQLSTQPSSTFIFYCISLIILSIILIILFGIIFLNTKNEKILTMNDDDYVGEIINDAFLPCAGDFEFVESENEKHLYKYF